MASRYFKGPELLVDYQVLLLVFPGIRNATICHVYERMIWLSDTKCIPPEPNLYGWIEWSYICRTPQIQNVCNWYLSYIIKLTQFFVLASHSITTTRLTCGAWAACLLPWSFGRSPFFTDMTTTIRYYSTVARNGNLCWNNDPDVDCTLRPVLLMQSDWHTRLKLPVRHGKICHNIVIMISVYHRSFATMVLRRLTWRMRSVVERMALLLPGKRFTLGHDSRDGSSLVEN